MFKAQKSTAEPTGIEKEFKDYYPGIHEYMLKVRKYIGQERPVAASHAAALIQTEFNSLLSMGLNGCSYNEFNLYSEIHQTYKEKGYPDLIPLDGSTLENLDDFDSKARKTMEKHNLSLNIVESIDDLPDFLMKRAKKR